MSIVPWIGLSFLVALVVMQLGGAGPSLPPPGMSAVLATTDVHGRQPTLSALADPQEADYSTSFAAAEDPLSEAGTWINGGTTGIDWGNVRSAPGLAVGVNLPSLYGDPTAVLRGTWASNQRAQATVWASYVPKARTHEVELRLRTTITAHRITGYEIDCSVDRDYPHLEIVRWNGPLNDFAYLKTAAIGCADGDLLEATAIGDVITVYKNRVQVLQATDRTFASGSPGIGFYNNIDDKWGDFGLSKFSASNIR